MPPLRVYLDSSDYSVLSDPKRITNDLSAVLQTLREFKERGVISIYFSGTLLSEMAPLHSEYADAAVRRANLLVELCGRNAMLSQDRVFSAELRRASGQTMQLGNMHSTDGEWYPEGISDISPLTAIQMSSQIVEAIGETGLGRKERRAAQRLALKDGKPRAALMKAIVENARSGPMNEILAKYPMRPEDARVLGRFVVGDATSAQAAKAFEASLKDPSWMMLWFEQNHAQLTPFIEWTRSPAKSISSSLSEMAEHAASLRRQDAVLGTSLANELLSAGKWESLQDSLLCRIASRFCAEFLGDESTSMSSRMIDQACPGLSVAVRSLQSAAWTVTAGTPRKPKLSDFPDAMHAVYAPYVDIFRADSFMAPYIARQSNKYGTTTVAKLVDLSKAITERLTARK